jgi:hypothetical protein
MSRQLSTIRYTSEKAESDARCVHVGLLALRCKVEQQNDGVDWFRQRVPIKSAQLADAPIPHRPPASRAQNKANAAGQPVQHIRSQCSLTRQKLIECQNGDAGAGRDLR